MVGKLKSYRKYTAHRLGSNILEQMVKCKKKMLAFMIWLDSNYEKKDIKDLKKKTIYFNAISLNILFGHMLQIIFNNT